MIQRRRLLFGISLVSVLIIMYIFLSQQEKQVKTYQSIGINNATPLHQRSKRGPPYLTYIISSDPVRFNSTMKQLTDALPGYFDIYRKQPVPFNDSRIMVHGDMKVSSLLLTHIDIWTDFGSRPEIEYVDNDWLFVFEDDVGIVPAHIMKAFYSSIYSKWQYRSPNPALANFIEEALELAKQDGILYLGTCGPTYTDDEKTIRYSKDGLVQFRRGLYFCTHAITYTKRRARTLWGEFGAYRMLHSEVGTDTIAHEWQRLSKTYPLSAGANIHWPPGTGHFGFFYQDRGTHVSTIQG